MPLLRMAIGVDNYLLRRTYVVCAHGLVLLSTA